MIGPTKSTHRLLRLALVLFCVSGLVYFFHQPAYVRHGQLLAKLQSPSNGLQSLQNTVGGPANETLGFGTILAVSRLSSPRREGLLFAANLTDLDIAIPQQPIWTDQDLEGLRAKNGSTITYGSSLAWLGHLNALKWFLSSPHETALILEDDVDWDIHLRTVQTPLAASALRTLLGSKSTYWSDLSKWELLYLGHCGDFINSTLWANGALPHQDFPDPTLPPIERMHPHTQSFLLELGMDGRGRMAHKSALPLCTFGYAVTRASAERILRDFSHEEENHGTPAYDVRILEACRDLGWACYTINPEIFHHISESTSEIQHLNHDTPSERKHTFSESLGIHNALGGNVDWSIRSEAPNIACGARSPGFLTKDPSTMEFLKHIISKGHCLIDWFGA